MGFRVAWASASQAVRRAIRPQSSAAESPDACRRTPPLRAAQPVAHRIPARQARPTGAHHPLPHSGPPRSCRDAQSQTSSLPAAQPPDAQSPDAPVAGSSYSTRSHSPLAAQPLATRRAAAPRAAACRARRLPRNRPPHPPGPPPVAQSPAPQAPRSPRPRKSSAEPAARAATRCALPTSCHPSRPSAPLALTIIGPIAMSGSLSPFTPPRAVRTGTTLLVGRLP
jgi:hypothetical protein